MDSSRASDIHESDIAVHKNEQSEQQFRQNEDTKGQLDKVLHF